MDQSAKLGEYSSLVLVVWGQKNGQREIIHLKSDLKVLCLHVYVCIWFSCKGSCFNVVFGLSLNAMGETSPLRQHPQTLSLLHVILLLLFITMLPSRLNLLSPGYLCRSEACMVGRGWLWHWGPMAG